MLHAGVNIHRLTSCTKHFHTMIGFEEWRTCVRAWDAVKGCWFGKTCAAAARRTRLGMGLTTKLSASVFTIIVLLLLAVIVSISTVAAGDIEKKPGRNCCRCFTQDCGSHCHSATAAHPTILGFRSSCWQQNSNHLFKFYLYPM